jgi:hypothetical protein
MRLKTKILITTIVFLWLATCSVFLLKLPEILFGVLTRYYESNPKKIVAYLEDRYSIIFPKSINAIKAATATEDASGNVSFIIRFQMNLEDVNGFLANFGKGLDELEVYKKTIDFRSQGNHPEWFNYPINTGRTGHVYMYAKNIKNISFPFDFHVDLSNPEFAIVYMEGNYKSDCG